MTGIALAGGNGRTGSVMNHIHARGVIGQPVPVVGMGATLLHWTDREPATIIAVEGEGPGTRITIQTDFYTRTDKNGFSEDQTYDYTPNPNGATYTYRMTKEGFWQNIRWNPETKRWNKAGGSGLRIGHREKYWDPSF